MTKPTPVLKRVAEIAEAAGARILELREVALKDIVEKPGEQGPVTIADRAADTLISKALYESHPHDLVVTEESWPIDRPVPRHPSTWFVDPLDGTKDFVRGGDDYSVIIGHATAGVPDLGVVHHPPSGKTWAAHVPSRTVFTRSKGGRFEVSPPPTRRAEVLTIAASRSHNIGFAEKIAAAAGATTVRRGSVGLKAAMIVDGNADAYVSASQYIKVWDTCGSAALLFAHDHRMTDLHGTPLQYVGTCAHVAGVYAISKESAEIFGDKISKALSENPRAQRLRDT